MSMHTDVVVMLSGAGGAPSLADALGRALQDDPRANGFGAASSPDGTYASDVEVVTGRVNHADEDTILDAVRTAVHDPAWRTWQPLTVLFLHEDDQLAGTPPRAHRLSADGTWDPRP